MNSRQGRVVAFSRTCRSALRRRGTAPVRTGAFGLVALMVSAVADLPAEERIGRLFSSPGQRIELDRLRDAPAPERAPEPVVVVDSESGSEAESEAESGSERDAARPLAVRIDGVVLRGGVHRIAWVNGVMAGAGTVAPGGIRIDAGDTPDGRVLVRWSDGGPGASLKPGQEIDAARSRVVEVYESLPRRHPGSPESQGEGSETAESAGRTGVGHAAVPDGMSGNPEPRSNPGPRSNPESNTPAASASSPEPEWVVRRAPREADGSAATTATGRPPSP